MVFVIIRLLKLSSLVRIHHYPKLSFDASSEIFSVIFSLHIFGLNSSFFLYPSPSYYICFFCKVKFLIRIRCILCSPSFLSPPPPSFLQFSLLFWRSGLIRKKKRRKKKWKLVSDSPRSFKIICFVFESVRFCVFPSAENYFRSFKADFSLSDGFITRKRSRNLFMSV